MAKALPSAGSITEKTALYVFTHKLPFFCTNCFVVVKPIQFLFVVFVQNASKIHVNPKSFLLHFHGDQNFQREPVILHVDIHFSAVLVNGITQAL